MCSSICKNVNIVVSSGLTRRSTLSKLRQISEYLELEISTGGYLRWPLEFRWRDWISSRSQTAKSTSKTTPGIFFHLFDLQEKIYRKSWKLNKLLYFKTCIKNKNESFFYNLLGIICILSNLLRPGVKPGSTENYD